MRASRISSRCMGTRPSSAGAATAQAGDFDTLVRDLLVQHYDPAYTRSIERNFPRVAEAITAAPRDVAPAAFAALARELLDTLDTRVPETVT